MPQTTPGEGDPAAEETDIPLEEEGDDAVTESASAYTAPGDAGEATAEAGEPAGAGEPAEGEAETGGAAAGEGRTPATRTRDRTAGTIRAAGAAKAAAATARPLRRRRLTTKSATVQPAPRSGRYTAPIPKEQRHSPRWYPWVLLGFLILGLLSIVLNYVHVLPGGTNNWYLIGGIAGIVVGLFMATFYH